jgi:hypothetical protein
MQGGGSNRITHPIRHVSLAIPDCSSATKRSVYSILPTISATQSIQKWWKGVLYFTLHIPIVCALTLCGDSMAELVREDHVSQAIRWFACETYATGMIGIWCLAMLEHERDAKGELWLPKVCMEKAT